MTLVKAQAKRWGNSLGVIIPKDVVDEEHIKEHAYLQFLLLKDGRKALKEVFGIAKGKLSKPSQQLKDELRSTLYD